MTPERIEEIKREYSEPQKWAGDPAVVNELLAALEEAQQQTKNLEYTIETLKFNRDSWEVAEKKAQVELAEAQQAITALHEYNHRYAKERDDAKRDLAEAQQTIALKQSSIEVLCGQVTDETALHAKTAAKLIVAEQTIARQREALEWYATQANHTWHGVGLYDECTSSAIFRDKGKLARAALGGETQP